MLACRVRIGAYGTMSKIEIPEGIYVAQDSDFSGTTDGSFKYIGTELEVKIPHVIKGVAVTSYASMFYDTNVTRVVSDNLNVTDMNRMFYNFQATTLDLSSFNTSNVTDMSYMFRGGKATILDLSSFDTSNVTNMFSMFTYNRATTLDLSSFDTSNVTNTAGMFYGGRATTGYARTQADADKFNAASNKPARLTFVVKP